MSHQRVPITNTLLTITLLGIATTSVVTRSTLHKIGLGLLTIGTVAATTNVQQSHLQKLASLISNKQLDIEQLQTAIEKLKVEYESKIVDLEQSHRQEVAGLAVTNQESFGMQIELINKRHSIKLEQLKAEHHAEIQASNEVIATLRGNIKTLQKEFEAIRDDYAQRVATLESERSHFDAAKRDFEMHQREVKLESEQMLFQYSKQQEVQLSNAWDTLKAAQNKHIELVTSNKAEIQRIQAENQVLRERLGLTQKQLSHNNGRYGTASTEGYLADRIESFYRRNQLPISYVQAVSQTADRVTLQFTAKEDTKDDIIKLNSALSADVFSGASVTVRRKDGYLFIDVPKVASQVNLGSSEKLPDTDYLSWFIQNSNHILVSGATGDGKTTLISNLLDLASTVLPGAKLIFLNPKPSATTKFYFRGQPIKADYLNLETPPGCTTPNCIQGLEYVNSVLIDRMAQAQQAIEQDKPQPDYPPLIVFLDEIPLTLSFAKELVRKVMENLSRVAREYKIIFVGAGQGASVAQWGLSTRDQMQNFSRVYLKSVINTKMVFENELKFLPNITKLQEQLADFQQNVKYWGLFIPQGNSLGTVTHLPKPNYFVQANNCPSCGSSDVVKNGSRDGQQRMLCKTCDTSYSIQTVSNQYQLDDVAGMVDKVRQGLTV